MTRPDLPSVGGSADMWGNMLNAWMTAMEREAGANMGWRSGRWYNIQSQIACGFGDTGTLTANSIYATPIWAPADIAIDRVGLAVQTGAGTNTRMMLFDALSDGHPGNLLQDYGLLGTSTSGDKELTVAATLPSGLSWLACLPDGAITTYMFFPGDMALLGGTSQGVTNVNSPFYAVGSTNAPSVYSTSVSYLNRFIRLSVRAA